MCLASALNDLGCGAAVPARRGTIDLATMVVDMAPGQSVYDGVILGQVPAVIRAQHDADPMRVANESRDGLGDGIFCKDESRARSL